MRTAGFDERKQKILDAINAEVARQQPPEGTVLDLVALAAAIDAALGGDKVMPGAYDDGREPEELNAANDG